MNRLSLSQLALVGGLALAGFTAGCTKAKVSNLPDGQFRITCERGMKDCVSRAEKLCHEQGYTILSGRSTTRLLGGSSSGYRQLSEAAELEVICGDVPPEDNKKPLIAFPPRGDRPEATGAAAAASGPLCVPGLTQKCVGVGACEGGQVCLADGTGYGPCECAPAGSGPSASPSPASPLPPAGSSPPPPPAAPQDPPSPPGSGAKDPAPSGKPVVPNAAPQPSPL